MSADSPRRNARGVPAIVPPQVVSDRSIIDSVAGFINDVTLVHQPQCDPKDTITWARFETAADISDPRFGDDWELEGNVAPPLLLILGYGQGVQVWAIPANGEAVEVLSWRHGIVSALRVLPTPSYAENGRADEPVDAYADKRPLMAICDGTTPAGNNPQFCAVNFVSLKTSAQVKTIKFKNPVLDILANRSSIIITFHERIAVFDARSLEDRLSVTTCFPSPGINPNPVALGSRWMAYSENRLLHSKRSGGGCDGDGVASYTATVLNAAKSFGKGLRELGEQVAAGLTGTTGSGMGSKSSSFDSATGDVRQAGVVTILDIKHPFKDVSPTSGTPVSINGSDPVVAHFIAHSEAVVAMEFDNSGMMLLTADRRGHDFHLFRIQPHPVGSSLAAVHHLYVLHRGDTSAKVQNITFSLDSRWVAVSTLRGTTHVFPITPYGGTAGVRTHTSLHVVNKLSRFHRSAGLTADGRSSSPISHSDSTNFSQMLMPYHNPTLPPFPRPTVVLPLAQLRQPFALGSPPGSAAPSSYSKASNTRQRLSSLSDDNGKPLSVCAVFAKSRSWLLDPPNVAREVPHKIQRKAVDSLFVMAGHGALIQYDLDTKLATNVAKEKICDDTPIELEVEAKAQWNLGRKDGSLEVMPPLTLDNWLIKDRNSCMLIDSTRQFDETDDRCDSWLSQVEIITHAGPHRRLWMGPQFVFKTYNTPSGSNLSHIDVEAVEIGVSSGPSTTGRPERSSPLNMPLTATGRSAVPVLIESGSYSSIEQSPKLMDRFRHEHMNSDFSVAHGDSRLKEDLADAMRESPSVSHKDTGGYPQRRRPSSGGGSSRLTASSSPSSSPNTRSGDSGGVSSTSSSSSSAATLVGRDGSGSTSMAASVHSSQYESFESLVQQQHMKVVSIEKVVNPLGTVTTITGSCDSGLDTDDILKGISGQDCVIHENCDESLFRPVVAIFCDENSRIEAQQKQEDEEYTKPPEAIGNKLIVPVIEKAVDLELSKKESMKNRGRRQLQQQQQQKQQQQPIQHVKEESDDEVIRFDRKSKNDRKKQMKAEPTLSLSLKASKTLKQDARAIVEEELAKTVPTCSKSTSTKELEEDLPKKKSSDKELKSKSIESGKIVQTKVVSGEESSIESSSDQFIPKQPSSDKIIKSKSPKIRKSEEKETLSEKEIVVDKSLDKSKKIDQETKSDPTEVKSKKEEERIKKTKGRKSEEKEIQTVGGKTDSKNTVSKVEAKELVKTESIRAIKLPKSKLSTENQLSKDSDTEKPTKPDNVDDDDEKPMEFKRMSIASLVKASKSPSKIAKTTPLKASILSEEKLKSKTIERKSKLEKGSSVESADSVEIKIKSEKLPATVEKGNEKTKEDNKAIDQVDSQHLSEAAIVIKTKVKSESKKKQDEEVKPSLLPLAIELSNASDLADSLLDFSPDKVDKKLTLPVEIDKLKKKTDDIDLKTKIGIETEKQFEDVSSSGKIKPDLPTFEKELKKISKKSKADKLNSNKSDKTSSSPELVVDLGKLDEPTDIFLKTPDNGDTIIVVEEKIADESESSDSSKNLVEISSSLLETKTKGKKKAKAEKAAAEKAAKKTAASSVEMPLSEQKSNQIIGIFSSGPSRVATPPPIDKISTVMPTEIAKQPRKDKSNELTGSKITVKPIKVETFLSDLMDSQELKTSPTQSVILEESPKKLGGSPLKFVDTYADATVTSEGVASRKEKLKKKPIPGKVEILSNKSETSLSSGPSKPSDEIQFFDKFLPDSAKDCEPTTTPWKAVSTVEKKAKSLDEEYPTLGKLLKTKKSQSRPADKKEKTLTFTIDIPEEKKSQKQKCTILDDLPILQPLEDLPMDFLAPLPALGPLEGADENISLINFESPLQEISKPIKPEVEVEKSSPQFPKGFPADNIIFALCGSLHYENENSCKPVDSPLTQSYSDSTAHTTAEYKSLTENDDQYLSLEQSSQENVPSTSSSTCEDITEAAYSSGGGGGEGEGEGVGDKIPIISGKMKSKQRRKKQLIQTAPDDDEELRPLINKNDDVNLMTSSIMVSKAKSMNKTSIIIKTETLPPLDNNQINSDSSSSDQANTSEELDDQICLNVQAGNVASIMTGKSTNPTDKSVEDEADLGTSSTPLSSQPSSTQSQQQQQSNSSKKKLKRRKR